MFTINSVTIYLAKTLLIIILIWIIYSWILKTWNFFAEKNVTFVRGWPVLGSHTEVFLGRASMPESFMSIYKKYPQNKIIGLYEIGGKPSYLVKDLDLIRDITVKNYDYFLNHYFRMEKSLDPLLGRTLFSMSNQPWRDMRSTLSPLFTGSKMRLMMTLMIECVHDFNTFVRTDILTNGSKKKSQEYNIMELMSRLANDVIGSTAFGLKMNSFTDPNNQFYKAGTAIAYAILSLKTLFVLSFPRISKWLRLSVFSKEDNHFFRNVIRDTVDERQKNKIIRNDMLHLLLLAKEGRLSEQHDKEIDQDTGFATISEVIASKTHDKLKNWTEDDLVAQCVLFFLAGFTGIATTFSFLCYELSVNEDAQNKLYDEIVAINDELDGKPITFECLQKMKYLDNVVSEVLRLWPIGSVMDRAVSKQYVVKDYDGNKVLLQPNDVVWIPVFAIHRNPEYWPEADKFMPERFSDENRKNIRPETYMPFGYGPRACIASRYALLQLKVVIYYILLTFRIECSEKTPVPLKLKLGTAALTSATGFWNRFTVRE